ncbi:MAG: hypothetical protein ACQEP3_03555, partial [Patescibacteria group bacterium]
TKIVQGKIGNENATNWNKLLRKALKLVLDKGYNLNELNRVINLNVIEKFSNKRGFRPIPDYKISMQDVESTKAANNLEKISLNFNLKLYIEFFWRDKAPTNPGKRGIIKIN